MADISYSLYITHFPFVLLIASMCYGNNQLKPDILGISQFLIWTSVILLIALLFWWLFEQRTDSVRNKIFVFIAEIKTMDAEK
jgi:peptidoglycan/LPS O-acetylase OafA/YrhL